jgi:Fe2+ or Zn2+ uptake regulation protein
MEKSLQQLHSTLNKHRKSVTNAREEVFRALYGKTPLSMSELTEICTKSNRASVYRTIKLFEQLNIITRIYTGWKFKIELAEPFTPHHHHLICSTCSKAQAFTEPRSLHTLIHHIAKNYNFYPSSHQFEIEGMCKNCQQKTTLL